MHLSDRTVLRWLADETYPQHDARASLDALDALATRLQESFVSPEGNVIIFPDRLGPGSIVRVEETVDPELYVDWTNTRVESGGG